MVNGSVYPKFFDMKSRSLLFTVLVFWGLGIAPIVAQNLTEKTLVKSFNLNGRNVLKVDFSQAIDVKKWNEPTVRIEMNIAVENMNEATFKSLIVAGRYNVQPTFDNAMMTLSNLPLQKSIKFNNTELKETIRYTLFVPQDLEVLTKAMEMKVE